MFLQHLNMITESWSSKSQGFCQKIVSPIHTNPLRIYLTFIRDVFLKFVHCPQAENWLW